MHHQAQMRLDGDDGFRDFEVRRDKGQKIVFSKIYFEVLVL